MMSVTARELAQLLSLVVKHRHWVEDWDHGGLPTHLANHISMKGLQIDESCAPKELNSPKQAATGSHHLDLRRHHHSMMALQAPGAYTRH
jgi:hypothetical protein